MTNPKQSQTVHIESLGEELSIYDWQRSQMHSLNPTAAAVWEMCDGHTSPDQMTAQLGGKLTTELDETQAEALVWKSLDALGKAHLLENEVVEPAGMTRRKFVQLGAAVALPVIVSMVAPYPVAAQSPPPVAIAVPTAIPTVDPCAGVVVAPGTQTFAYTGGAQTFTVPACVTRISIYASGAQGADTNGAGVGGLGGVVAASIVVTPGETLTVMVGGQGALSPRAGTPAGGYNGGGGTAGPAGTGGGASDLRRGVARLVVAGGGGGGGSPSAGANGGAGGDLIGVDGVTAGGGTGGGGGTQVAGGAAGVGIGTAATSGSSGTGGVGGDDAAFLSGGGGGGGWFGGGGGGGGGLSGGGGGGSSYTDPGATGVAHTQGGRAGDGQVVITW